MGVKCIGDSTKVGLLKGLPGAETNLKLFEADIYTPDEFVQAVQGCQVVVHMATPLLHNQQSSKVSVSVFLVNLTVWQ